MFCARPCLEYEDEFVLRAIERAHAGVGLGPDDQVLQLGVGALPAARSSVMWRQSMQT